jgi:hypothetical protein
VGAVHVRGAGAPRQNPAEGEGDHGEVGPSVLCRGSTAPGKCSPKCISSRCVRCCPCHGIDVCLYLLQIHGVSRAAYFTMPAAEAAAIRERAAGAMPPPAAAPVAGAPPAGERGHGKCALEYPLHGPGAKKKLAGQPRRPATETTSRQQLVLSDEESEDVTEVSNATTCLIRQTAALHSLNLVLVIHHRRCRRAVKPPRRRRGRPSPRQGAQEEAPAAQQARGGGCFAAAVPVVTASRACE